MLHIIRELCHIIRRIQVAVLIAVVRHIISDIVRLPKLVTINDSYIHSMTYGLVPVILGTI